MAQQQGSGGLPAIPKGKPTVPPKGRAPSPASDTKRSAPRKGSGIGHRPGTRGR
jgi:hypothetical protein